MADGEKQINQVKIVHTIKHCDNPTFRRSIDAVGGPNLILIYAFLRAMK
jgi:hypothetical protein